VRQETNFVRERGERRERHCNGKPGTVGHQSLTTVICKSEGGWGEEGRGGSQRSNK
jgi:hypothetical protein